jgi:hypothetical protein
MSNHLHLIVRDEAGDLASWASYFLGNFARAVNRIRRRSGSCFERRYSAEPILDDESLVDRLAYTVTNPVKAGLCRRVCDWPGVVLFAPTEQREEFQVSWSDTNSARQRSRRAQASNGDTPKSDDLLVHGTLVIDPLPLDLGEAECSSIVDSRETELAEERRREALPYLGRARVLSQSWHSAPRKPKRSPRPLCHAASARVRKEFREGFEQFVSLFREACAQAQRGQYRVTFPDWSFPPGGSLVRPSAAHRI